MLFLDGWDLYLCIRNWYANVALWRVSPYSPVFRFWSPWIFLYISTVKNYYHIFIYYRIFSFFRTPATSLACDVAVPWSWLRAGWLNDSLVSFFASSFHYLFVENIYNEIDIFFWYGMSIYFLLPVGESTYTDTVAVSQIFLPFDDTALPFFGVLSFPI